MARVRKEHGVSLMQYQITINQCAVVVPFAVRRGRKAGDALVLNGVSAYNNTLFCSVSFLYSVDYFK